MRKTKTEMSISTVLKIILKTNFSLWNLVVFRLVGQYKALHSITATNPENSIKRLLFNVRWVLEFQGRHYKIEQLVNKNRTLIS